MSPDLSALFYEEWEPSEEHQELLLEALESHDPRVLLEAFDAFAATMSWLLAEAVLGVADREELSEEIRMEALQSLVAGMVYTRDWIQDEAPPPFDDEELDLLLDHLRRLHGDRSLPNSIRQQALETACKIPREWQEPVVREAWASDDPDWRHTAVFCMGDLQGFEDELLRALDDPLEEIRYEAVTSARRGGVEGTGPRLLEIASDPGEDEEIRIAAVDAIGMIGPEGAEEVLTDILEYEKDELGHAAYHAMVLLDLVEEPPEDLSDLEGLF